MDRAPGMAKLIDLNARQAEKLPPHSDEALALRFTQQNAENLRYVAKWNRWFLYRDGLWVDDSTLRAFEISRILCRETAMALGQRTPKIASQVASAKTAAAIVQLARADRRIAATVEQWDADPWLLNTPGGSVDLRTGKLGPHRREDYCTKRTAITPGGGCPLWHKFLIDIFNGDVELIAFLQRAFGYALTGSIKEHALFFCYGTGANGKGVLISTVTGIMADYAKTAPMETFTASKNERHPTDLAMLRGARLVTAQETERGRSWAEAKIKALTGGDVIAARFMRQDFFEYTPQFKLMIAGNHKPGLRAVNEAIKRRINLIPFMVTIPEEKRDKQLAETLKAEWPGILAWAIEGCLNWQEIGLSPPEAVKNATAEYLEAEDAIGQWLSDKTECDLNGWVSSADLFHSYKAWAQEAGEPMGSEKGLVDALKERGFKQKRQGGSGKRGFLGLRIVGLDHGH